MSEYKTLDEFFPNGRGDGRKFISERHEICDPYAWFEPMFKSKNQHDEYPWHGMSYQGYALSYSASALFKEWREPKKTKKVTLYKPILRVYDDHYRACHVDEWCTDKNSFDHIRKTIVGWLSQEVEVDCD